MEVNKTTRVFRGTDAFMGPEFLHLCCPTGLLADIWSLGITAFVMLMGYLPIFSRNKDRHRCQEEIYSKIASLLSKNSFNPFSKISENAEILRIQGFIISILIVDPEKRLTAEVLLKTLPDIE
jgi:serine/threonine protein kinase